MQYNDLHAFENLQFIPVNEHKQPLAKNWQESTEKFDLSKCHSVGLVCGKPSGNLEAIDIDLKYSLDGKLFQQYKTKIHEANPDLLKKLVVQKTKSGGYHFLYRCSKIDGNKKLANRPTTKDEQEATKRANYEAEIKKGTDTTQAEKIASKIASNDKVRVLIETRGIGGQIVCFPSKGYELIYGDFYGITEISELERETLFQIARQFNEFFEEAVVPKKTEIPKTKGLSPFEDYNQRGDVVSLLEHNGWRVVGNKGKKTVFLRPGETTSASSGNFDHERNWFSVFTTSTEFEPQTAYLPYAVFAFLECNKDFSKAAYKLMEMGYGEKQEKKEPESTRVIKSRVAVDDGDYTFLAKPDDYDNYLQQVRDGTLPMGLTTGSPELDKHFLFKTANLVMINGIDNVGKSSFTWYLLLIAAIYHGWKGVIFSSENTLGGFMRKMIQYYWGKQLHGRFAMTEKEFKEAKNFIEKHFILIKAQAELYNYKDFLNMEKKARDKYPDLTYGMIDPYNGLKIDLSGFSKLSTHDYHYEALSEVKAYGQQTNFGHFITHHAYTGAARQKDGEKKYPVAPKKEDTEHGVKVPNKADDFLTVHRLVSHPQEWMITELHVRKIKDTDTGGRPTSVDNPVRFESYKGGAAFIEKNEHGLIQPIDPIHAWHVKNTQGYEPQMYIHNGILRSADSDNNESILDF